jgi:CO dehydrogenase maturation factor
MIIALSGKGGVGKTTISALLLDEVARRNYAGKVLVIDGDPAMTLAIALQIKPPPATLADVKDDTPLNAGQIRSLPLGMSPGQFVLERLRAVGAVAGRKIREMDFDLLVMGHGEKAGCYCSINQALTQALATIRLSYDLIMIDNEAGLEHISRYRLDRIDLFLTIMTPGRASWAVGNQIQDLARELGLQIGQTWPVYNRVKGDMDRFARSSQAVLLPECDGIASLDRQGGPLVTLVDEHPFRAALGPIVDHILAEVEVEDASPGHDDLFPDQELVPLVDAQERFQPAEDAAGGIEPLAA